MPCNSDYMNATNLEVSLSQVACLLDELKGKPIDRSHWNGYHPAVYSRALAKNRQDEMVEELCTALQSTDVSRYSLEMQMWWRDHQRADLERLERELQEHKDRAAKALALAKLSPYERELLGV